MLHVLCVFVRFLFIFFFQAEDGIRDTSVTGVQTCALPICIGSAGGYRMIVEDRGEHSFQELSGLSWGLIAKANQTPGLKQIGRASCRERGEVAEGGAS